VQVAGRTSKAERIEMLEQLQAAVLASTDEIRDTAIEEYGAPFARAQWVSRYASQLFPVQAGGFIAGKPGAGRARTRAGIQASVMLTKMLARVALE
jgi:hypothetical protein